MTTEEQLVRIEKRIAILDDNIVTLNANLVIINQNLLLALGTLSELHQKLVQVKE